MKNKIGFWGYPHPKVIERVKSEYPMATWFDLDFDFSHKVPESNILPESYCKIIKQIINNSLYFKDEIIKIVAPIGKDKCDSGWVTTITANIVEKMPNGNIVQSKPKFGFWGVPPNDLEVLKLFPDETHVYGWTRCVEAQVPADIELEMYVEPDVPTVFYAQAFCSKTQLAKYLANKYNGLYIDIDDYATNSVKAKIEAFLRLR